MTTNSDDIRARIAAASAELRRAQDDAALYDRISKAKAKIAPLQKQTNELTSALNDALADEAKAAVVKFEGTFRNLSINRQPNPKRSGLIHDIITISYDRLAWHTSAHESIWTPVSVDGFVYLDPEMLHYILASRPDLIPADIKALAPGNVFEAFDRYITAKSRGYMS